MRQAELDENILVQLHVRGDKNRPAEHEEFASSVSKIDAAELNDYWIDVDGTLPQLDERLWWEVWLDSRPGAGMPLPRACGWERR